MGCKDRGDKDDDGPVPEEADYKEYERLEKRLFAMPSSLLTVGELSTALQLRKSNLPWSMKVKEIREVIAAVDIRRVI